MQPSLKDAMNDEMRERVWAYQAERRRRLRLAWTVFVPGVLGVLGFIIASAPIDMYNSVRQSIWVVTFTLLAISGGGLLWIYLQTGFRSELNVSSIEFAGIRLEVDKAIRETKPEIKRLTEEVAQLKSQLNSAKASSVKLSDSDYVSLVTTLQEQVTSIGASLVLDEIKRLITDDIGRKQRLDLMAATRDRLKKGLEDITRRGVTNLWFGLVISLVGMGALGFFVYETVTSPTDNLSTFAIHFAPRLSVVVLIEVFAYFFLGLYKGSLTEIKYFQNELTNIEAKYLALQIASEHKNDEALRAVVQKLADTERNFILGKGQTTVELEKSKIERESVSTMLQSVMGALSPMKKS